MHWLERDLSFRLAGSVVLKLRMSVENKICKGLLRLNVSRVLMRYAVMHVQECMQFNYADHYQFEFVPSGIVKF